MLPALDCARSLCGIREARLQLCPVCVRPIDFIGCAVATNVVASGSSLTARESRMATHRIASTPETVRWGVFDASFPPLITVASGAEK